MYIGEMRCLLRRYQLPILRVRRSLECDLSEVMALVALYAKCNTQMRRRIELKAVSQMVWACSRLRMHGYWLGHNRCHNDSQLNAMKHPHVSPTSFGRRPLIGNRWLRLKKRNSPANSRMVWRMMMVRRTGISAGESPIAAED